MRRRFEGLPIEVGMEWKIAELLVRGKSESRRLVWDPDRYCRMVESEKNERRVREF